MRGTSDLTIRYPTCRQTAHIQTERTGAKRRDLEQSTRHRKALQQVDHLVLIANCADQVQVGKNMPITSMQPMVTAGTATLSAPLISR